MMNDDQYMELAIEAAKQNRRGPFGCVLVDTDTEEAVASGVNQSHLNPLLHGELVAISNYAKQGSSNWSRLVLFTTAEPCCMCQAGIIWAGIPKVVFGTSVNTLSALGWRQFGLSAQQVADAAEFFDCELVGGILEERCDQLFNRG